MLNNLQALIAAAGPQLRSNHQHKSKCNAEWFYGDQVYPPTAYAKEPVSDANVDSAARYTRMEAYISTNLIKFSASIF